MSAEERGDVIDGGLCLHLVLYFDCGCESLAMELVRGAVGDQNVMLAQLI